MKKSLRNTLIGFIALIVPLSLLLTASASFAATHEQGVDLSKYQGYTAVFGQSTDRFAISQIGGYYDGSFVVQDTYTSQVASTIAQGKRAHTYIYAQFSTTAQADQMLNYYLPKIQTPKNSIVALDVESGNPNTAAVKYALDKVKSSGYTAVLYGYKSFLVDHLDLTSLAKQYPLWLAEYPDYQVTTSPNYNFFPSFDNIHLFQFTSTYKAGGLDGNVDLTGITKNGYDGTEKNDQGATTVVPDSTTPAIDQGQTANNTSKSSISVGFTVKVNFGATKWATGESIPSWVKGKSYTVAQVSGSRVLLSGILSWINKTDVEILQTAKQASSTTSASTYTVKSGDFLSTIAAKYSTTYIKLASLNGLSNPYVIYPGQVLKISGTATSNVTYYKIVYGDTLSGIASKYGTSVSALKSLNGLSSDVIYAGNSLRVK